MAERRSAWSVAAVALLLGMTGCGDFFPPVTPTPAPTPTPSTSNYVYVANSTTSTISGFSLTTSTSGVGTLTAISGSPYGLSVVPMAMVVTPNNGFLYVAAGIGIYAYSVGTNGVLTAVSAGGPVALTDIGVVSVDVSPDGQWLFALGANGTTIYEYAINSSTGILTAQASPFYTPKSGTVVPRMIKVAPNGAYVFIALGTAGDLVYSFTTSTGALAATPLSLQLGAATTSDNALAVDSTTTFLYIARSGANGGLGVFSIGSGGSLTPVLGSPFATGLGPFSVVLDSTGKYVYVANRTDASISGFAIGTGGVLTVLSGSPYVSGSAVASLARDSSAKYVLGAASGGSPDLTLYSFDATVAGKLNKVTGVASGVDPAGSVMVVVTR